MKSIRVAVCIAIWLASFAVGQTKDAKTGTANAKPPSTKSGKPAKKVKAKIHYEPEIVVTGGKIRLAPKDWHILSKGSGDDLCWKTHLSGTFEIDFDTEDGSPFVEPPPYTVTSSQKFCPTLNTHADPMTYSYHITLKKEDGTKTKADPAIIVTN